MKLNTAIRAGLLLALSGSVLAQAPAPAPGGAPAAGMAPTTPGGAASPLTATPPVA